MALTSAGAGERPRLRVVLVMRTDVDGPVGVVQGSTMGANATELRAGAHRLVDRLLDRLEGRGPAADAT